MQPKLQLSTNEDVEKVMIIHPSLGRFEVNLGYNKSNFLKNHPLYISSYF
jgi:hypothetical protein